ncbi:MAG: cytochrome C [Proteobacteria bacterium]|nr:cytochrome C [Pseudomonadota bacterium]
MRSAVAAEAVVGFASLSANAQEFGDAKLGREFALKHCSECHAVEPDTGSSPNPKAPEFVRVAKTSGMTGRALAVWLDSSHPTMPNFVLHKDDRDDVIAYIMTLKKAPEPK